MLNKVTEDLKLDEGFRAEPYQCTEGVWTIGYGFTNLTEEEAEAILYIRVKRLHQKLCVNAWYCKLNDARKRVIINMAFQLGLNGLYGFHDMIRALQEGNYHEAAFEMQNSKWYRQTPDRAVRLMDRMRVGR